LAEGCPPNLPVIALTAHALPRERERFLALGMDECLTKPLDPDALKHVLSRLATQRLERAT
ncbi:MAG: response regulator, partial [Deltaproteobacteria bacterium]|nr:response regulator [Deltaproteobacteria bacterium]